jgi:hypothetical protein
MSRVPTNNFGRKDIAARQHEIAVRYQPNSRDNARSRSRVTPVGPFARWLTVNTGHPRGA